ncbi:MAG: YlbF family regulator [Firmicutes bacterium]|nr:YlbF family regulator [Bacillota bacterium]
MSVIDKAKELGEEIANSNELREMREAELMMMQDPEAQAIIKAFNEKRDLFRTLQEQGRELTAAQKAQAEELEDKMLDNPYIFNFFKAQQNFEKLLEQINSIIDSAIGGDTGCGCDSDDCGTCSCDGCH